VDCGAVDMDCEGVDKGNAFAGACIIAVGHRVVEEGLKTINEGCNDVDGGRGAVDEGRDAIVEVCEATDVNREAVDKGLDAVDEGDDTIVDGCNSVESCNAVCEDDVLAGVRAINVDRKAIDGGIVSLGVRVIDMGREAISKGGDAIDEGCDAIDEGRGDADKGCSDVDEGHEANDPDDVLVDTITSCSTWVTSSPSAAASISLVSCPLAPPTSALSFEFPKSLTLLM